MISLKTSLAPFETRQSSCPFFRKKYSWTVQRTFKDLNLINKWFMLSLSRRLMVHLGTVWRERKKHKSHLGAIDEGNSSFFSALQTFQGHYNSMESSLKHDPVMLYYFCGEKWTSKSVQKLEGEKNTAKRITRAISMLWLDLIMEHADLS